MHTQNSSKGCVWISNGTTFYSVCGLKLTVILKQYPGLHKVLSSVSESQTITTPFIVHWP